MSSLTIKVAALAAGLTALAAVPASAETITAVFTQPDGGVTTGLYSGQVLIEVSGVGQAAGARFNDAFWIYTDQVGHPWTPRQLGSQPTNFQLTFDTTTLTGSSSRNVSNFLAGGIPAYQPSHTYSFTLDTGVVTPTQLHFGVSDGGYADNSGAFRITVTQIQAVPEPMTIGLFGAALIGLGVARRRR